MIARSCRLGLATLVLVFGAGSISADEVPLHDPRAAHEEADTNDDGQVDRAEFHARMVEVFFFGDADKDGYLTRAELEKTVSFPDDFKNADRDGDGRYSLYEFIEVRFYDFGVVDTDDNGLLSVNEVIVVFERGGVR